MNKEETLNLSDLRRLIIDFVFLPNGTSVGWNLPINLNLTQPPNRAKRAK